MLEQILRQTQGLTSNLGYMDLFCMIWLRPQIKYYNCGRISEYRASAAGHSEDCGLFSEEIAD